MKRLNEVKLFLLDMDGTLYLGDSVFDGAREFVRKILDTGRDFIYLTNNSSRSRNDYIRRMRSLGFVCEEDNVFTSSMATGIHLTEKYAGKSIYLVGTKALEAELISYGVTLSDDNVDVVVVGFDTELTYHKLERACHHLRRGAEFIGVNMDWVCPMSGGEFIPDCGSICALLTAATGAVPRFIGKPNREMIDIIARERGIPNSRIAMVGDRMYTDIAAAINADAVSICVMSGETDEKTLKESEWKPDYVYPSVKELAQDLQPV